MTEYARKICKRLHAYLKMGPCSGIIRTLTPNALRLETSVGYVSVLSNTSCLQPFSLIINETKPFHESDLFEGCRVQIEDDRLTFEESELIIDLSQSTDIELSADVMKTLFLPMDLNLRLRHMIRIVEDGAGANPLSALVTGARIDASCESIVERLPALHQSVYEQDLEACRSAGAALAGYGNGATPDSDDLLEGYFAGYSALSMALGRSRERVRTLTREIAAAAAAHTTDLSGALLLQAGEGLVSEDTFRLLQSVFSDAPYRTLTADASRVARSVSPSGVNILVGIILAISNQYVPAQSM